MWGGALCSLTTDPAVSQAAVPHPAGETGAQRASEPLPSVPQPSHPPRVFTSCPLVTDVTARDNTRSPSRGSQVISRNGQGGGRAASERWPCDLSRGEIETRTQCGHGAQGKGTMVPALGMASLGSEDSVGTFCSFWRTQHFSCACLSHQRKKVSMGQPPGPQVPRLTAGLPVQTAALTTRARRKSPHTPQALGDIPAAVHT